MPFGSLLLRNILIQSFTNIDHESVDFLGGKNVQDQDFHSWIAMLNLDFEFIGERRAICSLADPGVDRYRHCFACNAGCSMRSPAALIILAILLIAAGPS